MNIVEKAKEIATKAHEGQKRWGGEPFITHPQALAERAARMGFTQQMQACCWLHDTIEDCGLTDSYLLSQEIPEDVIGILHLLTHDPKDSYLDYLLKLSINPVASLVKQMDLAHNLSTSKAGHKNAREKWIMAQWIVEEESGIGRVDW